MNYDSNGLVCATADGITVPAKQWTLNDIFPKSDTVEDRYGNMLPDSIKAYHAQLTAQRKLAEAAALIMDTMNSMNLTDDQRRSQKVRERMMKRKLSSMVIPTASVTIPRE